LKKLGEGAGGQECATMEVEAGKPQLPCHQGLCNSGQASHSVDKLKGNNSEQPVFNSIKKKY